MNSKSPKKWLKTRIFTRAALAMRGN